MLVLSTWGHSYYSPNKVILGGLNSLIKTMQQCLVLLAAIIVLKCY